MTSQMLMLARNRGSVAELWHDAVREGERCADIVLGIPLEGHLVMTLISSTKDVRLCRTVAREFLESDSESLINVAGRCLLIVGLFPALARRRNVRTGYFFEIGVGAYNAHANYWNARGKSGYAHCSKVAAERFSDLVKTLRGMKRSLVVKEEIETLTIPESKWN